MERRQEGGLPVQERENLQAGHKGGGKASHIMQVTSYIVQVNVQAGHKGGGKERKQERKINL